MRMQDWSTMSLEGGRAVVERGDRRKDDRAASRQAGEVLDVAEMERRLADRDDEGCAAP